MNYHLPSHSDDNGKPPSGHCRVSLHSVGYGTLLSINKCEYDYSAGVIGLNVALVLAEKGHAKRTAIVAEHLPGDTSINFTSPWYVSNLK